MAEQERERPRDYAGIADSDAEQSNEIISPLQMTPEQDSVQQLQATPLPDRRPPLGQLQMPSVRSNTDADEEEDVVNYNIGDRGVLSPPPKGFGNAPPTSSSEQTGMSFYTTGPETPYFNPHAGGNIPDGRLSERNSMETTTTTDSVGIGAGAGEGAGQGIGFGSTPGGTAVRMPLSPMRRNSIVNPEVEQRMNAMRARFRILQMMEDIEPKTSFDDDNEVTSAVGKPAPALTNLSPADSMHSIGTQLSNNSSTHALQRWNKLRKVVNSKAHFVNWNERQLPILAHSSFKKGSQDSISSKSGGGRQSFNGDTSIPIELEDVQLNDFWTTIDDRLAPLADISPSAAAEDDKTRGGIAPPELTLPAEPADFYEEEKFQTEVEPVQVTVNRIPEEVVNERKSKIEEEIRAQQQKVIDRIHWKEEDVQHREEDARVRLEQQAEEARRRLELQKGKVAVLALDRERALAKDFRRAREKLEAGIKRQQAAVKERFGSMLVHEETLARRLQASSIMSPQPIEFRIHMLRAVKTKLPKGAYVLMLTQYDSLGGRPLSWSQIGSNGIGNLRPGITRICKHYGRYFDRVLRVEDSVFALCPPQPLRKPNYIFALELFQLESRTNPVDKIVGWTALPMCYESMTLIEGKMKLPMMHGEHSPEIQLFKDMERRIASDLSHWLCNIYIEVRHLSLQELGATEDMLRTADFDFDYFNKSIIPADESIEGKKTRDVETGEGEDDESVAGSDAGGKSPKFKVKNGEEDRPMLMPVEKGIFRRKLRQAAGLREDIEANGATTSNASAAANTSDAVKSKPKGLTIKANDSDEELDENDGEDQHLLQKPPTSSPRARSYFFNEGVSGSDVRKKRPGSADPLGTLLGMGASKRSMVSGISTTSKRSDRSKPIILKNDHNFMQHRMELLRRHKANVYAKMVAAGERDEDIFDEVRERGYNIDDMSYLHKQQRGKIAGVESIEDPEHRHWAQSGLEGKIVRKWQSEGPRFDSEAILNERSAESPRFKQDPGNFKFDTAVAGNEVDNHQQHWKPISIHSGWQELRDVREMEDYSMSIASDPTRRRRLLPGAKARSKLRYIIYEMFGNFSYHLWGTFEFYISLLVYVFSLWIRIYVHYLGQYLYLESLNTPVFDFELRALEIQQKYMSLSISVAREVGVVAIGPIGNLFIFSMLIIAAAMSFKFAGFVPDVVSILFIAYGFATIFDPVLVILIDLIFHNYDCENKNDECEEDYTSKKCDCFNGDFVKLWYRMQDEEGSGLTGLFITVFLYMGTGICGMLLLYWYIVHVHRNGKVLDTWRRINAPPEEFFIPLDFEVTSDEVRDVINKAHMWRGPNGARRVLDYHTVNFPDGLGKQYVINEVEKNGRKSVYRQFMMEPSGLIIELFEDTKASNAPKRAFESFDADEGGHPFPPTVAAKPVPLEEDDATKKKLLEGGTVSLPPADAADGVISDSGKSLKEDLIKFDDKDEEPAVLPKKLKPSPRPNEDDDGSGSVNSAVKLKPSSRQGNDRSGLKKSTAVAAGLEGAEHADGYETPLHDPNEDPGALQRREEIENAAAALAAKAHDPDNEIFI